ncbi:dTMP kinase [Nigerium massiliense]|uniref:dTMP kinase n=1 Tax=Nigerium massiliense TaxID=1522317 RepID=UPI000591446A|nr:dTMP kinase [Nigerium massiliense]
MSGLFVVFEGGDGVGKSTQATLLADRLRSSGREVVRTFEPGDTAAGRQIRQILLDPATGDLDARAEALLYLADKAHHLHEVVRPALARGAVVVCDRYVDSMLAYQGAGRVLDRGELAGLARWATDGLRPDLTVLLDLEPARGVGAITAKDRLEAAGDDFHLRARQGFLELAEAEPERYLVLPARQPIETIAAAVRDRVDALLSDPRGRLDP